SGVGRPGFCNCSSSYSSSFLFSLTISFSWRTRIELRSLRDRKLRYSRLASHCAFARPGFKCEKRRSAHFPASSRGVLKGPKNKRLGHLRTVCADVFEPALNRLLGDSLFHDHRIAAIHLWNRFPSRQRVERLAGPECLDQCLSLARHFLAEFRFCRRRPGLNQEIAKVGVIAIPAPSRSVGAIGFRRSWPFRRLCNPFAFHIQSSFPSAYLRLPNPACCRTQSRFSPSI